MAKIQTKFLRVDELDIPVKLIREWRNSVRISIAKEQVNLRLPMWLPSSRNLQQNLDWAKDWIKEQFHQNPGLKNRFITKSYADDQLIKVNGHDFTLKINREVRSTSKAKIVRQTIYLVLNSQLTKAEEAKAISVMLSRVIGQYFLQEITERVLDLNNRYFKSNISQIRLKNNKSNWGSCSAKQNINLSTRLLFAPKEVQDYVIVHELAHLIELNHSKSFWKLISDIDPNYKEKESWLKQNVHLCQF